MIRKKKHKFFEAKVCSKMFSVSFKSMTGHVPFFSTAVKGWQLASQAFADEDKQYQKKQKWKSFFSALFNPYFASRWFEIFNSPDFSLVATHRPKLYLKPFRAYMSIRWTKKHRIKVILDTYRFILSKEEVFRQVITNNAKIEIARIKLNETTEGILNLGYDYRFRKEGELVLSFDCKQLGGRIVVATFSFEEMESARWVCRIGCIQGHVISIGKSSKAAQKLMHGLRPKSLIVFALQEFSRHLGLAAIYGAGDAIQTYRRKHLIHLPKRHAIHFNYDSIWKESGGWPDNDGWYALQLYPVRKKMEEIKTNKRALYRRRYHLLDDFSMKIADAVKRL